MKTLKNKLKKQGGFTLVEMLTVVAIIAILIAISIPMVTGALERARKATDAANARAAKAVMSIETLAETSATHTKGKVKAYNALKGELEDSYSGTKGYGKAAGVEGHVVYVVEWDNVVYYQWAATTAKPGDLTAAPASGDKWETEVKNDF